VVIVAPDRRLQAAFGLAARRSPSRWSIVATTFVPAAVVSGRDRVAGHSEIAWPIRYLLRDRPDVTTLFAT